MPKQPSPTEKCQNVHQRVESMFCRPRILGKATWALSCASGFTFRVVQGPPNLVRRGHSLSQCLGQRSPIGLPQQSQGQSDTTPKYVRQKFRFREDSVDFSNIGLRDLRWHKRRMKKNPFIQHRFVLDRLKTGFVRIIPISALLSENQNEDQNL